MWTCLKAIYINVYTIVVDFCSFTYYLHAVVACLHSLNLVFTVYTRLNAAYSNLHMVVLCLHMIYTL